MTSLAHRQRCGGDFFYLSVCRLSINFSKSIMEDFLFTTKRGGTYCVRLRYFDDEVFVVNFGQKQRRQMLEYISEKIASKQVRAVLVSQM